jgi:diguanylate cyclase (GGDEF)-like protein
MESHRGGLDICTCSAGEDMLLVTARAHHHQSNIRAGARHVYTKSRIEYSWPALAAVATGLVLSFVAAGAIGERENRITKIEFEGVAKNQAVVLQNGINEYLSRLGALRTLFESANDEITRSEFEVFSGRLFEGHAGILRVGWVPRVRRKERLEYESSAVLDGIFGYRFQSISPDGARTPAPESNEYFPIFYSTEPKTSVVYGIDLASQPSRRATLERARDNDVIAVLPNVPLLSNFDTRGILVAVPVYVKGTSRASVADRRRNIAGFILGMFDLERLLESVLSTTPTSSGVNLDIYSPDADVDQPSIYQSLFRLSSTSLKEHLIEGTTVEPKWPSTLRIGDATWKTLSTPMAGGRLATNYDRALIVLTAGLIVTAIIIAYMFSVSRHSRGLELANRRVFDLAQTDVLTGLANRRAFFDGLGEALAEACRGGKAFTIFYFDLDHFKDVNDTLGHAAGDELLRQVADRLRATVGPTDLVARFGGDEFAVLEQESLDSERADALADRICTALGTPYEIDGAVAHVTASIGIARYTPDIASADALMIQADLALYRAKDDGRNCCRSHTIELSEQVRERVTVADELRGAVARGELELHYQPQVELATGRILGLEALLRWHHPTRGLVPPSLFIPIAERSGGILQLGKWAFDEACRQYRIWQDEGIAPDVLAVNFSAVQFKAVADLESDIAESLERWRITPGHIEVELTETVLMKVTEQHDETLEQLRRSGLRIALDDFGTGYSSLSYLTAYTVNRLKIAQQLVLGVTTELRNAAVVRTAIRLANELGIECIAEGVETQAQANFLVAAGCEQAQGFQFSRPVSAARATQLLRVGRIRPGIARQDSLTAA